MDITPRFEPEPPSENDVFEVDGKHIEMMDWLTDELKYRVRTVAAHAYCRGKNREGPDTAFTEQEIMRGVERIRLRLEAEDEFIWTD